MPCLNIIFMYADLLLTDLLIAILSIFTSGDLFEFATNWDPDTWHIFNTCICLHTEIFCNNVKCISHMYIYRIIIVIMILILLIIIIIIK